MERLQSPPGGLLSWVCPQALGKNERAALELAPYHPGSYPPA